MAPWPPPRHAEVALGVEDEGLARLVGQLGPHGPQQRGHGIVRLDPQGLRQGAGVQAHHFDGRGPPLPERNASLPQ